MVIIGIDPSLKAYAFSDGKDHRVIRTLPSDIDKTQSDGLRRRCWEIMEPLCDYIVDRCGDLGNRDKDLVIYIEGPMLGAAPSTGSHLYDLGWVMADLHINLEAYLGFTPRIVEVNPSTIRRWATGKGNTKKDDMKLAVFKKFNVEFENDPGCDKLFAFLLQRFGEGVEAKEIEFTPSPKRGVNRRKKALAANA